MLLIISLEIRLFLSLTETPHAIKCLAQHFFNLGHPASALQTYIQFEDMGRPVTELIVLEPFQHQMFVLLHVLKWKAPQVTEFFDRLFEEMSKTTGYRMHVPRAHPHA